MNDVFISHVEEDADVALALALELERSGYSTWCYELDSVPGPTYFQQTRGAVVEAKVMVVIISACSLGSQQIERELVRAFELRKPFIPILRDISHTQFQERQPEWADILGAAASVRIPAEGVVALAPRVCEGLRQLEVPAREPAERRVDEIRAILDSPDAASGAPGRCGSWCCRSRSCSRWGPRCPCCRACSCRVPRRRRVRPRWSRTRRSSWG